MADIPQNAEYPGITALKLLEKLLFADLLDAARANKLDDYEGYLSQQFQQLALLVFEREHLTRDQIDKKSALLAKFFQSSKVIAHKIIIEKQLKLEELLAANIDWTHVVTGANPSFKAWKEGRGTSDYSYYAPYVKETVKKFLCFSAPTPDPRKPESTHMDSFKRLLDPTYRTAARHS